MSDNTEQLYKASYKGVDFFVTISSVSGGRKDIAHKYPNSDKQTIEDLGRQPRRYTLNAIISGDNYFQKRNSLLAKLEDGKSGVLSHPFDGSIENVVVRTFSLSERMSQIGMGNIEILFEVTDKEAVPIATGVTSSQLDAVNDVAIEQIKNDISGEFEVSSTSIGSYESATKKLDSFIDSFQDATKFINDGTKLASKLAEDIAGFANDVRTLAQDPLALADSIVNLFSTLDAAAQSIEASLAALANLFDFGGDNKTTPITASAIERAKNDSVIDSAVGSLALSFSYLNSPEKTYTTKAEISEALDALDIKYDEVANSDAISKEARDAIADMKTLSAKLFEDVRINAKRTLSVSTTQLPMRVIAYQYYGSTEQENDLLSLNSIADASFVSGDIEVLSE